MPKQQGKSAKAPQAKAKNITKPTDVARIKSATAAKHGGSTPKGSYMARMESAASRRSNHSGN